MRIMFNANIDPKRIKEYDKSHYIHTNIYLDKDKKYPLIEVYTDSTDIILEFGIQRFMCVEGDWAIEVQTGEGSFYHKFNGVTYHRNFEEDTKKDGNLHLYVKDRKLLI